MVDECEPQPEHCAAALVQEDPVRRIETIGDLFLSRHCAGLVVVVVVVVVVADPIWPCQRHCRFVVVLVLVQ
jgi:hypothetical protein